MKDQAPVVIVASDPALPIVAELTRELSSRGLSPVVTARVDGGGSVYLLPDTPALPGALFALARLTGGGVAVPVAIAVVDAWRSSVLTLLDRGFFDVVTPTEAADAVVVALRGAAPTALATLFTRLQREIYPAHHARLRESARRRERLTRDCATLTRAIVRLERERAHLRRRALARALSDYEDAAQRLKEASSVRRRSSAARAGRPLRGVRDREPRAKHRRGRLEEALDIMRRAGVFDAEAFDGAHASEATQLSIRSTQVSTELADRPVAALAALIAILEEAVENSVATLASLSGDGESLASAVERELLSNTGLVVHPLGLIVPRSVAALLSASTGLPADVMHLWAIDIHTPSLRPLAEATQARVNGTRGRRARETGGGDRGLIAAPRQDPISARKHL